MKNKVLASLIFLTLNSSAIAEYRVYQYYVRTKVQNLNPINAQIVTSTLNPRSYLAYNGGKLTIDLTLLRSWMCMGDTSHEDICSMTGDQDMAGDKK
jgi:hypothetical protein